jgi:DNA-binding transcriptional LysR family regulator
MSRHASPPAHEAPAWELYATFLAVMATGSLSAAARELKLTQPTVRRRIAELEAALTLVLFTRAPHGLVPTPAALAVLPHVQAMDAAARALVRTAVAPAEQLRGTVRVSASEVMGVEVLAPAWVAIQAAAPGLQLELDLSNRVADVLRRDVDVAVRMTAPTQAALVARKVGRVPVGLFARAELLAAAPVPETPRAARGRRPAQRDAGPRTLADLATGYPLIGGDRDRSLRDALERAGLALRAQSFVFRSDSDLAQLAAVRAGLGIGAMQVPLARREPGLVRVLPRLELALDVWLVTHEDLRGLARIRLVLEQLRVVLERYLGGRGEDTRSRGLEPAGRADDPAAAAAAAGDGRRPELPAPARRRGAARLPVKVRQ